MTNKSPQNVSRHEDPSFEPEIAADDAGATTLAEKVARKAPEHQVADHEKAELAEEASRQSDA